jgi:predicted amidohydrolase YtcJ
MSFIKMVSFITVDNEFATATAMAVKMVKIFAIGSQKDIDALNLKADTIILAGQFVYPGLIDAHCHFFRLGNNFKTLI